MRIRIELARCIVENSRCTLHVLRWMRRNSATRRTNTPNARDGNLTIKCASTLENEGDCPDSVDVAYGYATQPTKAHSPVSP
jgi:hypothetical protein